MYYRSPCIATIGRFPGPATLTSSFVPARTFQDNCDRPALPAANQSLTRIFTVTLQFSTYILLVSLLCCSAAATLAWRKTGAGDRQVTVTEQNSGQIGGPGREGRLVVRLAAPVGTAFGW